MNKSKISVKRVGRLSRYMSYLNFRLRHPRVRIIHPNKIGTFYSQDGQDLFLASLLFNYLSNNPNPWVVDVGCNHPSHFSNSLFFEKWLGCKVLGIDPLAEFGEMWLQQRPSSTFIAAAIASASGSIVLRVPKGEMADNMFSSVSGGVNKATGVEYTERTVQCYPMSQILGEQAITEVMLMSIDVEGVEIDVLRSLDFEKTIIRCFVIENNSLDLYGSEEIRDFLSRRGYIFIARIGILDDVFVHASMINGHPDAFFV